MKKPFKIWMIAMLLIVTHAICFLGGRDYESYYYNFDNLFLVHQELKDSCTKHYEAACLEADFIRYLIDHFDGETECANIGSEIEECYYEFFDSIDIGAFDTKQVKTLKDLQNYGWCY